LPSLKEIKWLAIAFIALPIGIYLLSYSHFFWLGYTWEEFVHLQKQMWWYHTNLKASHPYQSVPYQWIFNLRPVWMHVDYTRSPEMIANIYNVGNAIILYFGLASVILTIKEIYKKWSWQLWFCLVAYFMVWVPWSFSPRIMLFYHYAPAIPMLCILLSRQLEKFWLKDQKYPVYAVTALAFLWFTLFYPHHTDLHVPKAFAESVYFLIPSWR
jgi:dolichyl-phosphate-mannose-protein mannosyltransferase